MSHKYAIELKGLGKSYGLVRALHGLDLTVLKGEILGFLGPNGAGKTTTIRCMLNSIRPDQGSINVLGMDPRSDSLSIQQRVGYLPGELNLEGGRTAGSLLKFLASLRPQKVSWQTIQQMAERLGLDLGLKVKNLSKGNKQKVGVVQAFMHSPELLLLDEPTSGLDPLVQREVHQMVREANQAGATIFFSSHILSEVEEIADRAAIIKAGRLVEVVEPDSLIDKSLMRVRIWFKGPAPWEHLAKLETVSQVLSHNGRIVDLLLSGDANQLIQALSSYQVTRLETEVPSLEEMFLVHYQ